MGVPGQVRVRSNVVLVPVDEAERKAAGRLVPGDLLREIRPKAFARPVDRRGRQFEEFMYQQPCSLCQRRIHEIARDGCVEGGCPAPEPAAVERVRSWRAAGLSAIEAERNRLAAGERDTVFLRRADVDAAGEVDDPDRAVERVIGLRSDASSAQRSNLEERARAALARSFPPGSLDEAGYVSEPQKNLISSLSLGQSVRALAMIAAGDGGELTPDDRGRAKFCAAHSSSALAVNSFAPWLNAPAWARVGQFSGFTELRFEEKLPTGLRGRPPNLDVFAEGEYLSVAIESKCLEFLNAKPASFQASYASRVAELAHPTWRALFESLVEQPDRFTHVDAGQLLRHYLGIKNRQVGERQQVALAYIYWEPAGGAAEPLFATHRRELEEFRGEVSDPEVPFFAISYPDLWTSWSEAGAPPDVSGHVAALRGRYFVHLTEQCEATTR